MIAISKWAARHIFLARLSIVTAYLFLFVLCLLLGNMFAVVGFQPSPWLYPVFISLSLLAAYFYPKGRNTCYKNTYAFRKTCDFILVISSAAMVVMMVVEAPNISTLATARTTSNTDENIQKTVALKNKTVNRLTHTASKVRHFFQNLKPRLKRLKVWQQILLIALTLVGTAASAVFIAVLACSLSCDGFVTAAVIVAVIGWSGILFATTIVIRRIILNGEKWKNTKPLE